MNKSKVKILVVDDNPPVVEIVQEILEHAGYEVMTAYDGQSALEKLSDSKPLPDIVITDIMMPGINGFELFEIIRANRKWAALPIIFLTGKQNLSDLRHGISMGAEAYITKPFEVEDLIATIEGVLKRQEDIFDSVQESLTDIEVLSREYLEKIVGNPNSNRRMNPFRPNKPVHAGMFVGRTQELRRLDNAFIQTHYGNPTHFLMLGERGIGKTSLLLHAKAAAEGSLNLNDPFQFIVAFLTIDTETTRAGLVRGVDRDIKRVLATSPFHEFIQKTWMFVQRLEISGFSIRPEEKEPVDEELMIDYLAHSLAETVQISCTEKDEDSFDGILILIDEADNASPDLDLGTMLKRIVERLQVLQCDKVMFGLAGLPKLRDSLRKSHPSSLRIFEELQLQRLTDQEIKQVIWRGLEEANKVNAEKTTISSNALSSIVELSEGFPHFVQQFAASAFSADLDGNIDLDDVHKGAFSRGGAIHQLGQRYYREDYDLVRSQGYRGILTIISKQSNNWWSKEDLEVDYSGDSAKLEKAIQFLITQEIIEANIEEAGKYRLRNRALARWIQWLESNNIEQG